MTKALDLFAGTGWGVACQWLGIEEMGVEIMPDAVATRAANGMTTIYNDVWNGLLDSSFQEDYDILIASPPCQTFSVAGDGDGRKALDEVLSAISDGVYRDPVALHELTTLTDPRTALVLAPLAHVWRDRPMYVVFEQVPPVLPVWVACGVAMAEMGYSVWTGNLHAEEYNVPQTRKRAVLIARRDGVEATKPRSARTDGPYSKTKSARWHSMFDALKWGFVSRPAMTVSNAVGRGLQGGSGARKTIQDALADGTFVPSIHAKDNSYAESTRITVAEAGVLQSYPRDFKWQGTKTNQFLQIGNAVPPLMAQAILRMFL